MKAVLHVSLNIEGDGVGASIDITDHELLRFDGIHTTDEPIFSMMCGDLAHGSSRHLALKMKRRDAANAIAGELASFIIHELQKRDTLNGYPLEIEDDAGRELGRVMG